MSPGKLPLGALVRLTGAGVAAYVGSLTGDPNLAAAIATAAGGYLANRTIALEQEHEQALLASNNCHLQLTLAGALRIALDEFQKLHTADRSLFQSWEALLEAALDRPTTLLAVVIPASSDQLLDATNPHLDPSGATEEVESLLRFWLAYQEAFERTKTYPAVPPSALPALPDDLHSSLPTEFLPEFQKSFAALLLRNDSAYARRAFERRQLQELVATSREHTEILHHLDAVHRLPLAPLRHPAPRDEERELEILRADGCAIPVVGREADLASLHAWLKSPCSISVRILTGGAGAGKTRLAIQLLQELDRSTWHAGFLHEFDGLSQRYWDRPTLAIVDYAATVAQPLKSWLGHLADQSPAQPLRVLLLEREADPSSGWLGSLLDHTSTGYRIAALLHPPEPQRVTPIEDILLRRQILEATLREFGANTELPAFGTDPIFDQRLGQAQWQDPLYLMMAALVARRPGGLPQALSINRTDLALHLADRELDRIARFLPTGAPPETAQLLTRLAGIVTACRPMNHADLVAAAREEGEAIGIQFPGGPVVAARRITEALTRDGHAPAAIEPDIIGEAVLLRSFGGENIEEGSQALIRVARRSNRANAAAVCFAIIRTCQDFATDTCQAPLDWVEQVITTGQSGDVDLLLVLEEQMPESTLVLRERAARVDRLLLDRFAPLGDAMPTEGIQATCARIANNLAVRLSHLGRREEALVHAQEAVRVRSLLVRQRPDAFLTDLAMSLNNLCGMLSDFGRPEEALEQAQEALRTCRQLAQQRPDVFLPEMATTLNNLAKILSNLGRREEALAHAQEAVRVRRQLAQQRPGAFLPGLALSLNNLSAMLSGLGLWKEALTHAQEAVRIRGQLAQQRPDAFLPDLATSLNNLSTTLSDLGRWEEGLAHAEDAVRHFRQLAQQHPDTFLPNLAMSLITLGNMLNDLGRQEEALELVEEGVRHFHQLAQQRPDTFMPNLASSLNTLASRLSGLGRREEALEHAQESVRVYRQLAQQRPNAFQPDVAISMITLAVMLNDLGRQGEATARAEEAVRIYRQLAQQHPDAFLHHLATSLNILATMLSKTGRQGEALEHAQEAVQLYRQLAKQRPDALLPNLAMSLNNLAIMLGENGRREDALEHAEEAVRIRRQLAQQFPDAFKPELAISLNNLAIRLGELGRREEALEHIQEAARLYHQLAQQRPEAFLPDVAMSLNNLAIGLTVLGRQEEALEHAQEAVRLYRKLAQRRPDTFLPNLARSLAVLGQILAAKSAPEGVARLEEAVQLLAPYFSQLPQAYAPLMQWIISLYLQTAQAAGIEPDGTLLAPLFEIFQKLAPTGNDADHTK